MTEMRRRERTIIRTIVRTILLALAASTAVAAVALFFIFRFVLPSKTQKVLPPAPYTIGVWEGKVAVFEGSDTYPMQIFDTDVAGLPAEQRAQVEAGVRVERPEELYLILEDYTS